MREESKVSIIVPVYNMENTVRRCLNSIQNQTYKNIEIMVINDGSGDSSDIIIRELAETDKRIKYISRPNKGLSLTLKEGIDLSSGEWLMFVDSDDYIDDNLIEVLVRTQVKENADVVQGNIKFVDVDGKEVSILHTQNRVISNKDILLRAYFINCTMNVTFAANLIRRELIKDVTFYKDSISTDLQTMPYVYANCKCFVQIPEPYYYAVQFTNSVSRGNVSDRMYNDKLLCNDILDSFFNIFASDLKEYMYYRRTGVAANLYMKIKYGEGTVTNREQKLKQCKTDFKLNYKKYMSSELLKSLPKKNRYKMMLFNFSPGILNMISNAYSKRIMTYSKRHK